MAVLLGSQEVARSPDFQIPQGDLKARPQLGKFFHRLQALFRRFRQHLVPLVNEVGEGHARGTAHSPPHLIELRKAEIICMVNDDGVGVSHIEAVFHNAGGKQDIVFPLIEIQHHPFQMRFRHLSVSHLYPSLRHNIRKVLAHPFDGFDAVVNEINLSSPLDFPPNGFGNDPVIGLNDVSLNGKTLRRGRFDDAHIPGPHQRHVEGAGDRRGRQCQNIDAHGQLLDLFLLLHSEALFFVHDEEP